MSFLSNIIGKKKKQLKATCAISKEPVEKGYGYMLSTAEVISSKKFWDNIMTEPGSPVPGRHPSRRSSRAGSIDHKSRASPWRGSALRPRPPRP